jgi:hypothetical protein
VQRHGFSAATLVNLLLQVWTLQGSTQKRQALRIHRLLSSNQCYLKTDSQSASLSWCQATIRDPDQFFFLLEIFFRQLRVCYFVAPSLTRGWTRNLLLLLDLASTVPLGSEDRGTRDHILLSQFFRLPHAEGSGPHILKEQGGPVKLLGTGFPFRRLVWLAGLRWRYSKPPTHGDSFQTKRAPKKTPSTILCWTSLQSYLTKMMKYSDMRSTVRLLLHVSVAAGTCLPSHCLAMKWGVHFSQPLPSNDNRDTNTDT